MAECGKCGGEKTTMNMAACSTCHKLYCNDCAKVCKDCLMMACPKCDNNTTCRFDDCRGSLVSMTSMGMF